MRRFLIPLLAAFAVATIFSCKGSANSAKAFYRSLDAETKAMVDGWKADPYGCKRFRTADKAEVIVKKIMEAKLNEPQIADLLGKPELVRTSGDTKQLSYYFDGACEGEKLQDGTVYCLAQLFLDTETGKTASGGVVCG